jgi:hypothetical protein
MGTTGGSRSSAGRPAIRRKCEQTPSLDIRKLLRRGLLKAGQSYRWYWSSGADRVGSVNVLVLPDRVILSDQRTTNGGPQWAEHTVWIERVAGGYGSRRMFACPQCGQRCAIVYFGSNSVACRTCLRLAFVSESKDAIDRLWLRQRRIERRLAGLDKIWDGWSRPRGMHQTTFSRLTERIGQIQQKKDRAFAAHVLPFLKRCGEKLPDL